MKWLRTIIVFDKGNVVSEQDWAAVHESYVHSIKAIHHPDGSGKFVLRRAVHFPKGVWKRNGVGYMRSSFLREMVDVGKWQPEANVDLPRDRIQPTLKLYPSGVEHREPVTSKFGGFDFQILTKNGLRVAIEWETGNISSSHRSINKLVIALASGAIQAGVVIVPSRDCYAQLTERIGNIGELSGYLELWEAAKGRIDRGLLAISVVEQDEVTDDPSVPYLSVGKDGRAKKAKRKAARAKAAKLKSKLKSRAE
jgi:hypothetical protein